mmetsp:Transcript_50088/g.145590  ORF Transcript_50088/g.145590 Transcript_50088/m.145590 type:complete len:213 (+) Transcript_50088:468-1106(+)
MHTVPKAPPGHRERPRSSVASERSAALVATWSAFKPPRLVPKTSTKSAVAASCSIHGKARSCKEPLYFTTGLDGSYQLPWISLMRSWGNPAFCGKPSWFCCTHEWMKFCCPRKPRAWCVKVGFARRVSGFQPTLFAPERAACPMTEAEIPAPVYTTVFCDRRISCANCLHFARMTSGSSWNSEAVSQLGASWSSRGRFVDFHVHAGCCIGPT